MMMMSMMLYVSSIRRAVGKLVGRSASIFVHLWGRTDRSKSNWRASKL